jgi:transposase
MGTWTGWWHRGGPGTDLPSGHWYTDHAATLLIVAGDNPERLRSEASFASLCGVSPIETSSGKVVRHRLNRGGDRDANRAVHLTSA